MTSFSRRRYCLWRRSRRSLSVYELLFLSISDLSANMFNWKKNRTSATSCQNVQPWNMYGIWKIWSHSIHQIFHSILEPFHTDFFPSIPCHSMPSKLEPTLLCFVTWPSCKINKNCLSAFHCKIAFAAGTGRWRMRPGDALQCRFGSRTLF